MRRSDGRPGRLRVMALLGFICATVFAVSANADPCGMVPPIYIGPGTPITRVGLQQTYVFFQDGIETFVIRPGFRGKVDQFGMLIPFPTPPSLRKVPDNVFQQIEHAIDPPEVVVDLRLRMMMEMQAAPQRAGQDGLKFQERLGRDEVRVINQEAVGMYQIAVLEAGSAQALKRWMDENRFVYPKGMDRVTNEYIDAGWCFVAVKTRVGNLGAVQPEPGQRQVDPSLPTGSNFDGAVQAMGFRFASDELVVPMRLSAFNEGELRNVVYLLTDEPKKIRSIPEEYVVRQLTGRQLVDHLTRPLPLRIIGGELKDIPEAQLKALGAQRNPRPHNGVAAQLFASDLAAVDARSLILEHESMEKELLNVGEFFDLRGADNDALIAEATHQAAERTVQRMMEPLKSMTMTVIDGDFPRDVLAKENLTFLAYSMPAERNRPERYDAKTHGPPPKQEGIRVSDSDWNKLRENRSAEKGVLTVVIAAVTANWVFAGLVMGTMLIRLKRRIPTGGQEDASSDQAIDW